MEPPVAPSLTTAAATATANTTSEAVESSPRHLDDSYQSVPKSTTVPKLRLMCSFGGHIVPRPHDKSLCYIGGDTRIVVVDRHNSLSDLTHHLSKTLLNNNPNFTLKYQLPNEDLDSLISVTTDEDLDNMIEEYDRINNSGKPSSRIRIFLFPIKPGSGSSIGSFIENSTKSEDWFVSALNGGTSNSGLSESNSVNCLLGLDDDSILIANNSNKLVIKNNQDVVPDSPMLDTTSSFGSASSLPSLGNLPPIRVQVEDQQQKVGIEEQFAQMGVGGNGNHKLDDVGHVVLSPPTVLAAVSSAQGVGEHTNRIFSDDERSDLGGVSMGYRKQLQQQTESVPSQLNLKPIGVGLDLASPDSISSDGSITNPLSRQKHMIYQDPIAQIPSVQSKVSANPIEPNITDPNLRVHMQQQFQDSRYLMQTQYDPQHHAQLHQQQPQFIHAGPQYIQHHPNGAVPMASYYPIYPSQQPPHPHHPGLDQQYPVYYVPSRQPQAYNVAVQQSGYTEAAVAPPSSRPQAPPSSAIGPPPTASVVQVSSNQHQPQYVGFSQIHHPSQSIAPTPATNANYAYEFADPTQAHMYYTQPMPPQMAAQYQTMTTALPDAAVPTESMKQQVRTSQI